MKNSFFKNPDLKKTLFLAGVFLLAMTLLPAHATIDIQNWTTKNGARVFFVETHTIPIIDIRVDFDAGSRRDPKEKIGLADMTNGMLARGIAVSNSPGKEAALSESEISDIFADTGAERGSMSGKDMAGMMLRTLSSRIESDRAIHTMARLLSNPSFPADLLERDKKRAISALKEALTKPDAIALRAFTSEMYGEHPYGYSPTPESLASITRDDLVAFHKKYYVADSAVISIVGDISRQRATEIADILSSQLNKSPEGHHFPDMPEIVLKQGREKRIHHPATQAHIFIGMPAIERSDPDNKALAVGNYILGGGGFVSRLMHEVREKRGLSYGVSSRFIPRLQKGPFMINLQTKKSQASEAVKVVWDTFDEFMKNGPTEEEMKAARDNIILGFPLNIDNNRKVLSWLSTIGFYNLPLDYLNVWTEKIATVTADDVRAAFARKLSKANMTTVIVGASD